MKIPEMASAMRAQFDNFFGKESVLTDALKHFREQYYQQLSLLISQSRDSAFDTDVNDEHTHVLNCLDILFDSNSDLSLRERTQLWWCVEDLLLHLNKYHKEISNNSDLSGLLSAIQHLVEPKSSTLSKNSKRENLYFAWYRMQFELKNALPTVSIKGGRATLDRWIKEITNALESDDPTRPQNHLANWAAGGLLDTIAGLETNNQFAKVVPVLKKIANITN
ncbi:hypothetical protein KBC89_01310 [Candidatus Woesebacteria bacterium]|nr:hypothetical protein [Candidatus Woesebacteria bacterium]